MNDPMEPIKKEFLKVWNVLDTLTRACEAGAYTGKTSPAVVQARQWLTHNKNVQEWK